jgi:hypothetical protein
MALGAHYAADLVGLGQEQYLAAIAQKALGSYALPIVSITLAVSCMATATLLTTMWTEFLYKDILKKQINRHICLTASVCMGFAMSMLGFGKIMNFLGSILEWLYPLMIIYAVYKLVDKNPTKTLIWFAQLKENIDLKQYYNYTSEPYYLNINKYIDKDETDNKYLSALEVLDKHLLIKFTNLGIDKLTILKRNYDSLSKDVQSQLQIAVKPSQIPIIKKSELKVNGHNRFKSDSDETSLVRPYTFFNNSYLNGINVYNFGLYPMQKHPSGTINFSFLNDLNLLIDFNNIQSEEIRVTIIGISYNLFRVMSGYGGLGFDIK